VLPFADSATVVAKPPSPVSSLPVSSGPWVQVEPERVKTHAAPALPCAYGAPTIAVLPSAESVTLAPNAPVPAPPSPVSLSPC
jgi:hypothetical protein